MLFKLILCIVILAAGALMGQLKAKTFDNRVFHLQDLITTLKVLESEMKYRLDPLPELFSRIGAARPGMSSDLLNTAAENLKTRMGTDLPTCWKEAVEKAYKESALKAEDKRILSDLGIELGKTDLNSQTGMFLRTFSLLEAQVMEASDEKKSKGRMYKSLGPAVGMLIVILLI
ncbi:hypothetical protein FRZ06_04925 [Anoxybacterium hadale]|uniref:Uncharacterized protein n=1 Tax=Anoxybacterium hadale TaxID=3408580 RepID=A0ACD1A8G6_9FIRM|nr:hypothetical protein FRZ06_04925 [Clostridiales bacterium]